MSESPSYEIRENYPNRLSIETVNKRIGITMSAVPTEFDPVKSIEVAFINDKGEFLEVLIFGPRELQADTRDKDFWTEFGERYGTRFKKLERFDKETIEKDIFPDLVEAREEALKEARENNP